MATSSNRASRRLMLLLLYSLLAQAAVQGDPHTDDEAEITPAALDPAPLQSLRPFPEMPIIVNDSTIERELDEYSPLVLDCWERGCRPCDLISPTIDQMARDLKGKIVFGKLCIDDSLAFKERYRIKRTPTLLVFVNGTLIYRHIGNYPQTILERLILPRLGMKPGERT